MDTSTSLLESLRSDRQGEGWRVLTDMYSPLIRGWLVRHGAPASDVDDLVQEVLVVVVRRMPEFRREPRCGAFRSWLRAIAANSLRDFWRRRKKQPAGRGGSDFEQMIEQWADPDSGLSRLWDAEHDRHVTHFLLGKIREEVTEKTWRAFERFALEGHSADETARELGMTPNAVFIAKSRVMSQLRELGRDLIE